MISRIRQRTKADCALCVVAMVMGQPYTYERVLADSLRYPKWDSDGKFPAWWETYLREQGFKAVYCSCSQLPLISTFGGNVVAVLGMNIPSHEASHVVAVDECGVVDPADGAPDHVSLSEYIPSRIAQGVVFDDEFLAVNVPRQQSVAGVT